MEETMLQYGLQPFWFWNGDMRREEIVRQIREMHMKGVPGFLIHPRQGMEIPYMSEEFFSRVQLAVDTAAECGMEVWLYDEYPYPSGVCGGEVMLDHPEYLCKHLTHTAQTVSGGEEVRMEAPWGRVVLARAFRIKDGRPDLEDFIDLTKYVGTGYRQEVFQYSGLTQYNRKRYFTGDAVKLLQWMAPEGQWRIYLVTETVMKHFKYFENFVDTLNPEAIQYFIQLTHERYKEHIGYAFGKTVKGFFSDEITAFPNKEPWSPLLPGLIEERYGIDFIGSLPALWEDLGDISSRVRYAYRNTATDRFIECYDKAVYEWCERNGLKYIGEKPIMRSKELKYVHIPGMDGGHQKVGSPAKLAGSSYRANGKIISSAAHFYDKPAALCEAGHSIGWGMTIQDMKWIFDWLAVQGVSFFIVHGFFYDTDGLKKHDAPPSAFFQMPWWEDAAGLVAHAKKLGDFLHAIQREVHILIVDPITSTWTADAEGQQLLQQDFATLQNRMLCEALDYYVIDPELFAEGAVIRLEANAGQTRFAIHGETYDVVLLPPMRNLEAPACRKILEFAAAGGLVGALSSIAFERIDGAEDVLQLGNVFGVENARDSWEKYHSGSPIASREKGNAFFASDVETMIDWLKSNVSCGWKITAEDHLGMEGLPSVCGTDAQGQHHMFLVNTTAKPRVLTVQAPNGWCERLALEPFESRMLEEQPSNETTSPIIEISLDDEMPFTLSNQNALRLSPWEAQLPDGQTAVVEAAPLIDLLEAGGFLRPIRQKNYFGCPKELEFEGTSMEFRIEINCCDLDQITAGRGSCEDEGQKRIWLVMEPKTFLGDWEICVNDRRIREADFIQRPAYLPTNLAVDVTDALREGGNLIRASVKTDVSFGGMRGPIYLFGDFGVRLVDGIWTLSPLPNKASMKDPSLSGLPFYYGEICFSKPLHQMAGEYAGDCAQARSSSSTVILALTAPWLTDSVRLRIGGYETTPCSWRPYRFEVPAELLKKDDVELEIAVRGTAIGLFEGQKFDQARHAYVDAL